MSIKKMDWDELIRKGLTQLFEQERMREAIKTEHIATTPDRYIKALMELFDGINHTPEEALNTLFSAEDCNTMICVKENTFYSMCAHHLLPFMGKISFAYLPADKIVGLSKIPRLIEVFARRPQVQEKLSTDIVNSFQAIVKPHGCAIMIRAYHMCCAARGIKQPTSYMETTALTGIFKTDPSVKAEFLASANASNWKIF